MTSLQLPRFPGRDEHIAIVGRNGTGKTVLGAFVFSKRDLKNERNIILDYKRDELLTSIERAREIGHGDKIPRHNGLYILKSNPDLIDEDDAFLRKIWSTGDCGIMIDEGYMVPGGKGSGLRLLLTQGRALHIPVMTLSQRPVDVDRFVFSEASHVAMFALNDDRDKETIGKFTPRGFVDWVPPQLGKRLPEYHSRYYSVKTDSKYVLRPVPDADEIRDTINSKLERRVTFF